MEEFKLGRPISVLELSPEERQALSRRSQASITSKRDHLRAQIVLLRSQGVSLKSVAAELGVRLATVSKWSQRFELHGLVGLKDKAGRGRRERLPLEKVEMVIANATRPPPGRKRWSTRSMAKAAGVSHPTVNRIWRRNDLKPHRVRTFKVSKDPKFEEKLWDVIGLYLGSP